MTAYRSPALSAHAQPANEISADLLVVPIFADDDLADEPGLDAATGGELGRARQRGEFTGKPYETLAVATSSWKTARTLLVGLGPRKDVTTDHLRRLATMAGLGARQRRLTRVAIVHRAGTSVSADQASQVMAEGMFLANFEGASLRTSGPAPCWI